MASLSSGNTPPAFLRADSHSHHTVSSSMTFQHLIQFRQNEVPSWMPIGTIMGCGADDGVSSRSTTAISAAHDRASRMQRSGHGEMRVCLHRPKRFSARQQFTLPRTTAGAHIHIGAFDIIALSQPCQMTPRTKHGGLRGVGIASCQCPCEPHRSCGEICDASMATRRQRSPSG